MEQLKKELESLLEKIINNMKVIMKLCNFILNEKEYSYPYFINEDCTKFKSILDKNWISFSSYDEIVNYFKFKTVN